MNVLPPQETLNLPGREDLTYKVYGFSKETNIALISHLDKVWSLLRSKHTDSRRLGRAASAPGFAVGGFQRLLSYLLLTCPGLSGSMRPVALRLLRDSCPQPRHKTKRIGLPVQVNTSDFRSLSLGLSWQSKC